MVINITNGEFYNEYFEKNTKSKGIPFNEAMMSGPATFPIFSNEFIESRSKYLSVSNDEYVSKMSEIIDLKKSIDTVTTINLFFGNDTFCVINLLTLLAYLEQLKYQGVVVLNIIDDFSFKTIEYVLLLSIVSIILIVSSTLSCGLKPASLPTFLFLAYS